MDNPNQTTPQTGPQSCCVCGKVNFKFIIERAQQILLHPKTCWQSIKAESHSIKEIYVSYLLIVYAIPPICMLIKWSLIGVSYPLIDRTYRLPFFGTLFQQILTFLVGLLCIYVCAVIIDKLAPKFEGRTDITSAFRLVAYSLTPACLAAVFILLEGTLGGLLTLAGGIYSLYIFYQGIPTMTAVPESRRLAFFVVLALVVVIINLALFIIISAIARPPMPRFKFPGA